MRPCASVTGNALHPMHAALILQPRECAATAHLEDDFLEAAAARLAVAEHLGLEAMLVGPPHIHAEEIIRKQRRLIAARAGPDLDDDILLVQRVFRHQEQVKLLLARRLLGFEARHLGAGHLGQLGIALVSGHAVRVGQLGLGCPVGAVDRYHILDLGLLAAEVGQPRRVGGCRLIGHQRVQLFVAALDGRDFIQ